MSDELPDCYSDQDPEKDACMPPKKNRIDPVAAPAAGSSVSPSPGAGGWVPPAWFPFAAGMASATLASVAPVVAVMGGPVGLIVGAVLAGAAAGLGTWAGTKSAGPRAP